MEALPPLFDTHCHWDFSCFDGQREAILGAAAQVGLRRLLVPGVTADAWPRIQSLCASDPRLLPAWGLHPGFLQEHPEDALERLETWLKEAPPVALGEVGLDFWKGREDATAQARLLDHQLELARSHDLPVLFHVRKAQDDLAARLRRHSGLCGGIVHAFSGSLQQAEVFVRLGLCIGVGGAATYPRARKLRRVLSQLPLEALVLETDAPDMPIQGHQGEINRPDRLPLIFQTLASLRSEPPERLAQGLWENSCRVLGLDPAT